MEPSTADIASLLEVVGSEAPGLLPSVVAIVANSPARPRVLALCKFFKVNAPSDLPAICAGLAQDLNRLQRKRGWVHPRDALGGEPNCEGLLAFAERRAIRWQENNPMATARPLWMLRAERLLSKAVQTARARAEIQAFLNEKPSQAGVEGAQAMIAGIVERRRCRNA